MIIHQNFFFYSIKSGSVPPTNGKKIHSLSLNKNDVYICLGPSQNGSNLRPNANTNRPTNGGNIPVNGGNRPINAASINRPNNGNQGETLLTTLLSF